MDSQSRRAMVVLLYAPTLSPNAEAVQRLLKGSGGLA